MAKFKDFDEICEADPIQRAWGLYDRETGEARSMTLRDFYEGVARIKIGATVPDDVQDSFITAKNLLLYSWFVYEFISTTELQAYTCVELGLKMKANGALGERPTLHALFEHALEERWLIDDGFTHFQRMAQRSEESQDWAEQMGLEPEQDLTTDDQDYSRRVAESFRFLRNQRAHGKLIAYPGGFLTLELTADIQRQLFG